LVKQSQQEDQPVDCIQLETAAERAATIVASARPPSLLEKTLAHLLRIRPGLATRAR
jgi:hypothetical protein